MSEELKPCPMPDCGSDLVGTGRLPCGLQTVSCGRCGLSVPETDDATAQTRWNRHASPPAAAAAAAAAQGDDEEVLALHRKLAAEKLRADTGWARYESANKDRNDLRAEKAKAAQGEQKPVASIESTRADFEEWYKGRYSEPLASRECARQWSTWLAASSGTYKAHNDWKISPVPWGPPEAFVSAAPAAPDEAMARDALEPFAKIADLYDAREDDRFKIHMDFHEPSTHITLGQCRAARAAIAQQAEGAAVGHKRAIDD